MKNNNTSNHFTAEQGILPMFPSEILNVDDPVLMYDRFMEEIDLKKYLRYIPTRGAGRPRYNPVNMLKTIIYGFAEEGYCSFRKLEDNCRVNIRYMYLMNYEAPSYRTFCHFVKGFLKYSLKDIFYSITKELCGKLNVDLQHIYIDGSKFEANANKYSWVWKKSAEKSRYKLFAKITSLFELLNDDLKYDHMSVNINTEYAPDYLRLVLDKLKEIWQIDETAFVHGSGHRKSDHQRKYEQLKAYTSKLEEYVEKIQICGTSRNSYSKTDTDATFMRIKSDYMGNDQLLPAYNVQIGVADEFIAVIDVNQYRSDMDCFVPLMEEFHEVYGAYPKYPVADAGYGSFNNYIYCEQHGMEKYMKFPMYKKETKDKKYHTNPFRPINFRVDENGTIRCPNDRAFKFIYRHLVRGNLYGRQEEVFECEDCQGCPLAEQCKKTPKNKRISLNRERNNMYQEVQDNLESIHGALLRMNRSIQAEGTFGIMKHDRWYKRIVRKRIDSVKAELYLVALGYNLRKYITKIMRIRIAA